MNKLTMAGTNEFVHALLATRKGQDAAAEELGRARSALESEIEKYLVAFDRELKAGWAKTQLTEAGFFDPTRLNSPKKTPCAKTKPAAQPGL